MRDPGSPRQTRRPSFAYAPSISMRWVTDLPNFNRLIAKQNHAALEGGCRYEFQVQPLLDSLEDRRPVAQRNRIDHDLIFIDQTLFRELGYNASASEQGHLFSRQLFHLLYFYNNRALHQLCVVPLGLFQRP